VATTLFLAFSLTLSNAANAADELLNPDFNADVSGWTGARQTGFGNSACLGGTPNIGTWENGKLSFSYVRNTVYQDVVISVPSLVTIFFEAQNRGDQIYTQWFSASLGDATTVNFTPPYISPISASLTIRTTVPNQVIRIAFTGQDQLFWAGCYGPRVGNLSLVVDKNTTVKPAGTKARATNEGIELRLGKTSKLPRS
jgi:hypothetical protein